MRMPLCVCPCSELAIIVFISVLIYFSYFYQQMYAYGHVYECLKSVVYFSILLMIA